MAVSRKHYDYFIFGLSVYVFIELSLEFVLHFSPRLSIIASYIDFVICMIFLSDWTFFYVKAQNKGSYFFTHLFDLISSLPFIPGLRFLRLFRIFRFIRGFRGLIGIYKLFVKKPLESALLFYSIYAPTVTFYSSLAFYKYEVGVNPKIVTYSDALWFAFANLTTIKYKDIYPYTGEGRIIAAFLVISGAGFFALLSGEFASIFVKASTKKNDPM